MKKTIFLTKRVFLYERLNVIPFLFAAVQLLSVSERLSQRGAGQLLPLGLCIPNFGDS